MKLPNEVCKHFHFWCQKVLPLVYDDSLSYYEVLCKLTDLVKNLIENQDYLNTFLEDVQKSLDDFQGDMDNFRQEWAEWSQNAENQQQAFEDQVKQELGEMADILDAIKNGQYVDLYLDSIKAYIDQNLQELVAGIVKYVVFGLSADGHFVAYIPKAWDFLHFSTITDPDSDLYNHLVMTW